jgi:hypothetical protein
MSLRSTSGRQQGIGGLFIILAIFRPFIILSGVTMVPHYGGFGPAVVDAVTLFLICWLLLRGNSESVDRFTGLVIKRPLSSVVTGIVFVGLTSLLGPALLQAGYRANGVILGSLSSVSFAPAAALFWGLAVVGTAVFVAICILVLFLLLVTSYLGWLTVARLLAINGDWRPGLVVIAIVSGLLTADPQLYLLAGVSVQALVIGGVLAAKISGFLTKRTGGGSDRVLPTIRYSNLLQRD